MVCRPPMPSLRQAWAIERCGEAIQSLPTTSPWRTLIAETYEATATGWRLRQEPGTRTRVSNYAASRHGFRTALQATSSVDARDEHLIEDCSRTVAN